MKKLLTKEQITYLNSLDSKTAKHKFLLDCLVEKFSLGESEEFKKPPLEYNHWIKNDEDPKWLIYFDKKNKKRYGFDSYGNWFESLVCYNPNAEKGNRYASAKEVETALISEGKNRGFNGYVSFKPVNALTVLNPHKGEFGFDFQNNKLLYANYSICNNGTWAEIIEQKPTDFPIEKCEICQIYPRIEGSNKCESCSSYIKFIVENDPIFKKYRPKPNYSPEEIDLVKHNIKQREVSEQGSELLKFDKLEEDEEKFTLKDIKDAFIAGRTSKPRLAIGLERGGLFPNKDHSLDDYVKAIKNNETAK